MIGSDWGGIKALDSSSDASSQRILYATRGRFPGGRLDHPLIRPGAYGQYFVRRVLAAVADRLALSERSGQEICHRGLGVHPKWLIRCFRLQDAALRLETEANVSLSGLAQALGYFDQAHFTRDFKRATGVSPGQYRLGVSAGAGASA